MMPQTAPTNGFGHIQCINCRLNRNIAQNGLDKGIASSYNSNYTNSLMLKRKLINIYINRVWL